MAQMVEVGKERKEIIGNVIWNWCLGVCKMKEKRGRRDWN